MSTTNDGTTADNTTPEGEGSPDTGTPDTTGSQTPDELALARKRQAGAEAARQQAQKERDAALAELETYRSKERTASDKDLADNAKLKERLDAAEKRAADAEVKAEGRILDIKYPKARAELPEITDEVRLAKLEALLSDDEGLPPPPQNPNANNNSTGANTGTPPKAETSADIAARLKAMKPDWL